MTLRPKIKCEICGLTQKTILHRHHIIPRADPRSTNSDNNLAILCPNCHSSVHAGDIIIIGLYETSAGQELLWFYKGEKPPIPQKFWKIKENELVHTLKHGQQMKGDKDGR